MVRIRNPSAPVGLCSNSLSSTSTVGRGAAATYGEPDRRDACARARSRPSVDHLRRNTGHDGVLRDGRRDDASGCDHRALAQCDAVEDRTRRPDPDVVVDCDSLGREPLGVYRPIRPFELVVRRDDGGVRTDENVLADVDAAGAEQRDRDVQQRVSAEADGSPRRGDDAVPPDATPFGDATGPS